jgi:hypothetical protein
VPTLYPVRSTVRISDPPGGVRRAISDSPVEVPFVPSVCRRIKSLVFGDVDDPWICPKQIHGRFVVT